MTQPGAPSPTESPAQADDRSEQLLAALLRTRRLTVLHGPPRSGKTELLSHGVLPLLRRRQSDVAGTRGALLRIGMPFPERRRRPGPSQPGAEQVVHMAAWDGAPLDCLHAALDAALQGNAPAPVLGSGTAGRLADRIAQLQQPGGTRWLFVLDQFEACLAGPEQREDLRRFADEWIEALTRPALPAHFLVALPDDALALLRRFRDRIPALDDDCLSLASLRDFFEDNPALRAATPVAPVDVVPHSHASDAAAAPPRGGRSLSKEDVYASIETMLARTAAHLPQDPWREIDAPAAPTTEPPASAGAHVGLAPPVPSGIAAQAEPWPVATARPDSQSAPTPASPATPRDAILAPLRLAAGPPGPVHDAPHAPSPPAAEVWPPTIGQPATGERPNWRRTLTTAGTWLALAAAVAVVFLMPAPEPGSRVTTGPPQPAPPAPAPAQIERAPAPAPPARERVEWLTDIDDATEQRIADELAQRIAPQAGLALDVRPQADAIDALRRDATAARLAVAHHDALQATRDAGGVALAIVMPLYTEELHFLVRADSRLRYLHQIRGRRIDAGPAGSGGARTAVHLYERLFGVPPPALQASPTLAEAVEQLLAGKSDVVLLVAPQPSSWLAGLPPERAGALRALALDRRDPSSRKLLQAYLPAALLPASYADWLEREVPTLSVRSFLVAPAAMDDALLAAFARSVCELLPVLRREGHPKWRELQLGLQLDAGWPYASAAAQILDDCRA